MRSPTASQFFEHALPLKAAAGIRQLFGSQGSIAFDIDGEGWTFHFASADPVRRGAAPDADLQLTFSARAFEAFVSGTLDPRAAAARGEVRALGELRLLERFGQLLQTEGASLGWDHF